MWPREVFYCLVPNESGKGKKVSLGKGLDLVNQPGVYVLYRNDIPYYVGQAAKLRHRLWEHACAPGTRYHNFWNYFSAFVIDDPDLRNQIEGVLIAAMPTANGARPRIKRAKVPSAVSKMTRDIYQHQANPKADFRALRVILRKLQEKRERRRKVKAAVA